MDYKLNKQEKLLVFLTENMKEMETELRAQSIVLDALAQKIIDVDGLGDALSWARKSTAMQEFVRHKYMQLEGLCLGADRARIIREAKMPGFDKAGSLPN